MFAGTVFTGASAQSPTKPAAPPTASVSGRVTLDGKPVAQVRVALHAGDGMTANSLLPVGLVKTDETGGFRFEGLTAGKFGVRVHHPVGIEDTTATEHLFSGHPLTLNPGEAVENLEIRLVSGGVITGRVLDASNAPVIGTRVYLIACIGNDGFAPSELPAAFQFWTDDRGTYRLFGIPAGRYLVVVGGRIEIPGVLSYYGESSSQGIPTAFHPKGADPYRATVITITPGATREGVDIRVGQPDATFTISGRVVDEATGAPVANAEVGFGTWDEEFPEIGDVEYEGVSNAKGEFRLPGLTSKKYRLFARTDAADPFLGGPVEVTVTEDDRRDVIIKVRHGTTVSGTVEIVGTPPGARPPALEDYLIMISGNSLLELGGARLAPNGRFRVTGLLRGPHSLGFSFSPLKKRLVITRVEYNGGDLTDQPLEIGNEPISGVRIEATVADCKLRGEIRTTGGPLPAGFRYYVFLAKKLPAQTAETSGFADERGRFTFEGLLPGNYWLILYRAGKDSGLIKLKEQPVSISAADDTVQIVISNEGQKPQ